MKILGGGVLITHNGDLPLLHDGAVAYEGGRIVEYGASEAIRAKHPGADFLDAGGRLIMPGLINIHTHIYSALARGMTVPGASPSRNFSEALRNFWWRLDSKLTREDVRQSARITCMESIKNGVTTLFDHHAGFAEVEGSLFTLGDVAQELGLRASLCFEVSDRNGREIMRAAVRENRDWLCHCRNHGGEMLRGLFGLHASFTLSDESLDYCRQEAEDAGFHVHVAEDISDVLKTLAASGKRPVERFFDFGMLGPRSLCVHCIHSSPRELALLAQTDTPVAHNPESNMGNAVGAAPVADMMRRGILVGLGTDAFTADMLESMKSALLLGKHHLGDPSAMEEEPAKMLFENNRRIASRHFDVPLGIIKEGAAADLITVDYQPPTPLDERTLPAHLLFGLSGPRVDTVVIAGRTRMRGRALCDVDEEAAYADARAQAQSLWKRI